MAMIPATTMTINQNSSFGFTALESMIIEGRERAVTLIINERIVPTPTPFKSGQHLIFGINQTVFSRQFHAFGFSQRSLQNEILYVLSDACLIDDRAANHGEHESDTNIGDRDRKSEYARKKDKCSQIHQRT